MEYAVFISALVGMRAEVVTLRLNQVRRQHRRAVAVIVSDCRRESRYRNTVLYRIGDNIAQRLLVIILFSAYLC